MFCVDVGFSVFSKFDRKIRQLDFWIFGFRAGGTLRGNTCWTCVLLGWKADLNCLWPQTFLTFGADLDRHAGRRAC